MILYTRGGCYPSMHWRWYPSMPCSRSPGGGGGGACSQRGPAPGEVPALGGACSKVGGAGVAFCYGLLGLVAFWLKVTFWYGLLGWDQKAITEGTTPEGHNRRPLSTRRPPLIRRPPNPKAITEGHTSPPPHPLHTVNERPVRILLECILVAAMSVSLLQYLFAHWLFHFTCDEYDLSFPRQAQAHAYSFILVQTHKHELNWLYWYFDSFHLVLGSWSTSLYLFELFWHLLHRAWSVYNLQKNSCYMFIISKSSKTSILWKLRILNPRTAVVFPTEAGKECENGVWNFIVVFAWFQLSELRVLYWKITITWKCSVLQILADNSRGHKMPWSSCFTSQSLIPPTEELLISWFILLYFLPFVVKSSRWQTHHT